MEGLSEERRNGLIAFLIQHCYLVVVAVPTAEAARRIFTVLNARGLDLTPTDILKADLLERAGTAIEAPLANRWEQVEHALGREKMVELFGHIRMIYERDKPRLALEAGFPKFVPPFTEDADAFVSNVLEPLADVWLCSRTRPPCNKHFGSEAAKAVRSLERIDNKDWLPPVLLRMWKWEHDEGSAITDFLISLERARVIMARVCSGMQDDMAVVMEMCSLPAEEEVAAAGASDVGGTGVPFPLSRCWTNSPWRGRAG